MTDKTGLLVVPRFLMRLWGWCALNLFGPFPEPAFSFQETAFVVKGINERKSAD
ncbi:hypothetical protein [Pectobacterium carotovorum]|uniref:hypothetical protein n=1 Tax=Pectobacterium carotovorum TaxID=554 RepID=UPI00380D3EFB